MSVTHTALCCGPATAMAIDAMYDRCRPRLKLGQPDGNVIQNCSVTQYIYMMAWTLSQLEGASKVQLPSDNHACLEQAL
jgi:hypothetical protein